MKKQPEIMPFKVPEHVRVNMHNGQDFVLVPLSNFDGAEVEKLCIDFCLTVYAWSHSAGLAGLASRLAAHAGATSEDEAPYLGFHPDRRD